MDDGQLMSIRADTLFVQNQRGRMLQDNEPDGNPAPQIFLGCTRDGSIVRFGEGVPEEVAERLAGELAQEGCANDGRIPPRANELIQVELADLALTSEIGGPAYRFPESIPRLQQVVAVTPANAETLRDRFPDPYHWIAARQPCLAVVRDGAAVSVCFSSRVGAVACEAGVGTHPDYRGHGYAAAVTAAWGAAVRETGRIPLYSTSWDNVASQGVARCLGLVMFGSDMTWR